MPPSSEPHHLGSHTLGSHTLGSHVVGQRVVVRRVLRGETGPSGGPALTDVLGTCRSWARGLCEVVTADGTVVAIHVADIVSGKPVPPRPSVRHRATPREAHLRTLSMWPEVETAGLGEWVLRAGGPPGRVIARASSVLAMGDPGLPLAEAADRVVRFYAARDRPAWAQVLVDGEVDAALRQLGWRLARPGEADTLFQVAAAARVLRLLQAPDVAVALEEDGPRAVARVGDHAHARVAVDRDWVGLHDVWVAEEARGRGLARAAMAEALDWAASRGATTAYLQVRSDNSRALALYERLGFTTHHAYRYLSA